MPYYRIDPAAFFEGDEQTLSKGGKKELIHDPESGELLLRTEKTLGKTKGLKVLAKEAFEKAHQAQTSTAGEELSEEALDERMRPLLEEEAWSVEPYSERKAAIRQTAVAAKVKALSVEFGAGRSDTIHIGRLFIWPGGAGQLVIEAVANCGGGEALALGVVFTTKTERPWLELPPEPLMAGEKTTLTFSRDALHPDKLAKTERLNIVIVTDADEGHLLIERISLKRAGPAQPAKKEPAKGAPGKGRAPKKAPAKEVPGNILAAKEVQGKIMPATGKPAKAP